MSTRSTIWFSWHRSQQIGMTVMGTNNPPNQGYYDPFMAQTTTVLYGIFTQKSIIMYHDIPTSQISLFGILNLKIYKDCCAWSIIMYNNCDLFLSGDVGFPASHNSTTEIRMRNQ